MKNLLFLLCGSALLVSPSLAQTDRDISLPEFRQSMYDFATIADALRGTNLAVQFQQNVSDDTLAQWYKGIPDGRLFQQAVNGLKAKMAAGELAPRPRPYASQALAAKPQRLSAMVESQLPMASSCAAPICSVAAPSLTLFPPAYPDIFGPSSDGGWESMVCTLQTNPPAALSGGTAYNQRNQRVDVNTRVYYNTLVTALTLAKFVANAICSAVPDVLVVALGEGTEIPAKEICYGAALIISGFDSAAEGLYRDMLAQDDLVQRAEIEATYNNSLTLYNLKLRLKIEQNLQNTASPIGLFELPTGLGGYLEIARAIVSDTITKMTAAGNNANASAANTALLQGDTYFNLKSYKLAYKQYQKAYGLAVQ